ncbi:hypothetical protein [Seonamhaeicola sp. ML3]|uniref:hypothetical protein n=1 Tax=Seonamhaeicola sp. ML3 TaxID=2937786 RepID=UPI00200DAD17|nr:hypothetical protein [Seonamhaeicola sp. ML3]
MKQTFVIFLNLVILIFVGCKPANISDLNKRINIANKVSVENSPFDSAKSMETELKRQLDFRDKYTKKLVELRNEYPNQPIILTESYMFICMGCVADFVSIFTDGILYEYTLDSGNKEYVEKSKSITVEDLVFEGGAQDDIKEIYDAIIANENWNENPKKYGDENCFDGSQTFYTVYDRSSNFKSMYLRCWTPADFRTKN